MTTADRRPGPARHGDRGNDGPPCPWDDDPAYLDHLAAEADRHVGGGRSAPAPQRQAAPAPAPAARPVRERPEPIPAPAPGGADTLAPTAIGLPRKPINDPELAREALQHATASGFNVIGASMTIDHVPAGYRLAFRCFAFDACMTTANGNRVTTNGNYYDVSQTKDGSKLALHASALAQVAAVAGVEVESTRVAEAERFRWIGECTVRLRLFDGTVRRMMATKEIDVRDGSAGVMQSKGGRVAEQSEAWILEARKHGAAKAETGARARATRAILGIRPLSPVEAARPFVAAVLVYEPDLSDPWIRRALFMHELGVADAFNRARLPAADRIPTYVPTVRPPGAVVDAVAGDDLDDEP